MPVLAFTTEKLIRVQEQLEYDDSDMVLVMRALLKLGIKISVDKVRLEEKIESLRSELEAHERFQNSWNQVNQKTTA